MILNRVILGAMIAERPIVKDDRVIYRCRYKRHKGKKSLADVLSYKMVKDLKTGDHVIISGKLDMTLTHFGKVNYRIIAEDIEKIAEEDDTNILELSLVTDMELPRKEKTIRWKCYHIKYGEGTFPVNIYSHSPEIKLDDLEADKHITVKGKMDLWYNGLTTKSNMGLIVEEFNYEALAYFMSDDEISKEIVRDFLEQVIEYQGARKFTSFSEVLAEGARYLTKQQMQKITLVRDIAEEFIKSGGSEL